MALPEYVVWFRGLPACPCLARWLPVFERELVRRGVVQESIDIAQLIGGAEASGGTHVKGGAADIWQHDRTTVWVARQMGADAAWARGAPFDPHTHLVLRGCPHNGPARYQIAAVDDGFNGLGAGGRGGPDDGPRPLSHRTWREGIEWARQQEDIVASLAELKQAIRDELVPIKGALANERKRDAADRKRFRAILAGLEKLDDKVSDDASRTQVRDLRNLIEARLDEPEPTQEES